jgi:hypothetical protein
MRNPQKCPDAKQTSKIPLPAHRVRRRPRSASVRRDQTCAEPLQGRITLAAIVKTLKRKYHWPIEAERFPSNAAQVRATWRHSLQFTAARHAGLDIGGRIGLRAGCWPRATVAM